MLGFATNIQMEMGFSCREIWMTRAFSIIASTHAGFFIQHSIVLLRD
jgi:hypothetical protein